MGSEAFDVIVVGGGGSGLAAAVSAAENGASVLLLEKRPELGGTTGIAVGSYTACRTPWQQKAGIEDTPEAHAEDAGKFAPPEIEAKNNAELRKFFLERSAETLAWLSERGLRFYGPSPEPPNRVARMHNVVPNAKAYIAALQADLIRRGGKIICSAPVRDLIRDEGRIAGVTAEVEGNPEAFRARRGVILAAGDYSSSAKLISKHKGEQFAHIEGINPCATGDGHRMAESAGARMLNMDFTYGPELRFVPPSRKPFSQLLPGGGILARMMGWMLPVTPRFVVNMMIKRLLVTWQHPENALFDDGAILVNNRGERFCDETAFPDREIALARQPDKVGYIVLDERLIRKYSEWPHFVSTAPKVAYAYVKDYLKMRRDVAVEGSLDEVAARRGIPAAGLKETLNGLKKAGKGMLVGVRWVLLGPVKAYFTTTEGGAAIDFMMRVLDQNGEPIPGLRAAGSNGMGGQVLWGHGLHIAWALTSGRMAGTLTARETPG